MKTVGRLDSKETGTTAVYLSDGNMNMALVKNSPIAKRGVQLLGIKVPSIKDVGERLKQSAEYLYPGEAPITLRERPASGPYKTVYFKDPDGNEIDVSEEGWDLITMVRRRKIIQMKRVTAAFLAALFLTCATLQQPRRCGFLMQRSPRISPASGWRKGAERLRDMGSMFSSFIPLRAAPMFRLC